MNKYRAMGLVVGASIIAITLAACDSPEDLGNKNTVSYQDMKWPILEEDADIPVYDTNLFRDNYTAVLDFSGSMNEEQCSGEYPTKAKAAVSSLKTWAENVPADAALGLVVMMKGGVQVLVETKPNNHRNFIQALDSITADGGTPTSTAVAYGYEELERRGILQNGLGTYKMVVVTDGAHSAGYDPTNNVNWIVNNTPIEMYTIGFCLGESVLNQPGKTTYTSADDPEALFRGLSEALAESEEFVLTEFN